MKVISIEHGRATQLVVADEIQPTGGSYLPESIRLIAERYGFATRPNYEEASKGPIKFADGRLVSGGEKINIVDLTVFSNAVQVTAKHTSEADYVVDDIFAWSEGALGFRKPQTKFPRTYESAVVVEFNESTDSVLAPFAKLRGAFQKALAGAYEMTTPVALSSFAISADQLKTASELASPVSSVVRPELGIVRRLNSPFESNRFFSTAPLKNEAHLSLLEEFENALAAG